MKIRIDLCNESDIIFHLEYSGDASAMHDALTLTADAVRTFAGYNLLREQTDHQHIWLPTDDSDSLHFHCACGSEKWI